MNPRQALWTDQDCAGEPGQAPAGLSVKDIAERCDLTVASAYQQARTLTYHGYLLRRDATTYTLGLAALDRARDLSTQLAHLVHDGTSTAKLAELLNCSPNQVTALLIQIATFGRPTRRPTGQKAAGGAHPPRSQPRPSAADSHRPSGRSAPHRSKPPDRSVNQPNGASALPADSTTRSRADLQHIT